MSGHTHEKKVLALDFRKYPKWLVSPKLTPPERKNTRLVSLGINNKKQIEMEYQRERVATTDAMTKEQP